MDQSYEIICIGGGSTKGFYELGALHYLYEQREYNMSSVHTYAGTSIGSVIALLLSMNMTPWEIFLKSTKLDSWADFEITDFLNFKKDGGFLDIKNFINYIQEIVQKKYHYIPTMKELHDLTKKRLVISVANVTKSHVEYIDYETFPDLPCISAVQMSCSMPVIFKRFEYKGDYYVDGGLLDNFPINYVNDKKTKIIGVCVEGLGNTDDFVNYIYTLFSMPVIQYQRMQVKDATPNCLIINMKVDNIPINEFWLGRNKKMEMFCGGYKFAEKIMIKRFENNVW